MVCSRFEDMFEHGVPELAGWVTALADAPSAGSDADRVERIRLLEELKCAAEALQARDAVDLDASVRQVQRAGVPARRLGEGVAAQVGLARRVSPVRASKLLGLAKVMSAELPHTAELMRRGLLSEWRATIVARETGCLDLQDRREVDRLLCAGGPGYAPAIEMGDRQLADTAKKHAYRLDAQAFTARAAKAVEERTVTIRPAPDTMTWVTALLPVAQGVGVYAALRAAADSARATGDPRSRGQVMADTLVERAAGRTTAEEVSVEVRLVMTDRTLFTGDDEPAHLLGYGPVPAGWARALAAEALDTAQLWIRRLYTTPGTGTLVAMDSTARCAPTGLARFIETRDLATCRTPWCDAPARVIDHVTDHQHGGPTTGPNLQDLCERCNLAKQAPGWSATTRAGPDARGRHVVDWRTPTGHTHTARAPDLPGTDHTRPPLEAWLHDVILDLAV